MAGFALVNAAPMNFSATVDSATTSARENARELVKKALDALNRTRCEAMSYHTRRDDRGHSSGAGVDRTALTSETRGQTGTAGTESTTSSEQEPTGEGGRWHDP
eukprot:5881617-Pyramimonas_sp.AAC.1